eukprot:6205985-Karenia_brevis.AAC.1
MPVFQKSARVSQRGFIKGRDFGVNVVELDTWCRVWANEAGIGQQTTEQGNRAKSDRSDLARNPGCGFQLQPADSTHPGVLAFFDFASAFPSLLVDWLLAVLAWYGAPRALVSFVSASYLDLLSFLQFKGVRCFLGWVGRGVIQGNPFAALLFVLGIDPFVVFFEREINLVGKGIVRLCADDVGA